jgi:phospholipid transport system substrate-binding protein
MIWVSAFVLMFVVLIAGERSMSSASSNDPLEQLQNSIDEILVILQSEELRTPEKNDMRKKLILGVVHNMFDFRAMARSSLGPNWNNLNAEERERFVGLFASLVEQRYIGKIDTYDDQKVVYKDTRVKNDKAKIYTALVDGKLEIPIDYSLKRDKGKWLIMDMRIENVSLIANYRRDFNSVIRKEKFSGLVEKITAQLEKAEVQR